MVDTEKVVGAIVYVKDGKLGIEFTGELNKYEILYFLESFTKIEREDFEDYFDSYEGER